MKPRMAMRLALAVLIAGVGMASAAKKDVPAVPTTDAALSQRIVHEINMYPYYSIWDDIRFQVSDGQVQLMGVVNQPYKKQDIERVVQQIPGVTSVADSIQVLPLSNVDDRLRLQVARAIYGDPALSRYAMYPIAPIHILVENGHVTLTGVVATEAEKNIAGIRANGAGMSFGPVTNDLVVEHPPARKG